MKEFALQLSFEIIMTVLGIVVTAVLGFLAKKHVQIKKNGFQIDLTNTISQIIKTYTPMGIQWAEKQTGWDGKDKNEGVTKVIELAIQNIAGVKDAYKYEPMIKTAIEYYLNGAKLGKGLEDGVPKQAKLNDMNIVPVEDEDDADTENGD